MLFRSFKTVLDPNQGPKFLEKVEEFLRQHSDGEFFSRRDLTLTMQWIRYDEAWRFNLQLEELASKDKKPVPWSQAGPPRGQGAANQYVPDPAAPVSASNPMVGGSSSSGTAAAPPNTEFQVSECLRLARDQLRSRPHLLQM